jgi:type I restriction enzyme R subunit
MEEMRSRDRVARSKGLNGETELSFYHALEDMLDAEDRSIDEETLVNLTASIVDTIEERATVIEWKRKHNVQQQMRKRVKIQLYKSDIDLSGQERDELTNRIIRLARAHFQ